MYDSIRWVPITNTFDPNQPRDPHGRWTRSSGPHSVLKEFGLLEQPHLIGVAHDALLDDGRDRAVADLQHATRPGASPWELSELMTAYRNAHAVAEHLGYSDEVWSVERANNEKGYDATKARSLFKTHPDAKLVVISRDSPRSLGLYVIQGLPSKVGRAVVFYRKSSGGRWGRSSDTHLVGVHKSGAATGG